jgi:hypothetical protein
MGAQAGRLAGDRVAGLYGRAAKSHFLNPSSQHPHPSSQNAKACNLFGRVGMLFLIVHF